MSKLILCLISSLSSCVGACRLHFTESIVELLAVCVVVKMAEWWLEPTTPDPCGQNLLLYSVKYTQHVYLLLSERCFYWLYNNSVHIILWKSSCDCMETGDVLFLCVQTAYFDWLYTLWWYHQSLWLILGTASIVCVLTAVYDVTVTCYKARLLVKLKSWHLILVIQSVQLLA